MSTKKIALVRGDTRPQIGTTIKDVDTGVPVNLVGCTAKLYFRAAGGSALQATLNGILLAGIEDEDGVISSAPPYDTPGSGGRVAFPWAVGDLDTDPGDYEGEIEVTFGDGTKQTVYEPLKFKLREQFG